MEQLKLDSLNQKPVVYDLTEFTMPFSIAADGEPASMGGRPPIAPPSDGTLPTQQPNDNGKKWKPKWIPKMMPKKPPK